MRRTLGLLAVLAALTAPAAAQSLAGVQLDPSAGGPDTDIRGRVTLTGPAPAGGAYIQLECPRTIWAPGTVVVPEGSTLALFSVSVNKSARNGEATILASWRGQQVASNKLVTRADPATAEAQAQTQASAPPPSSATVWGANPYGYGYGYYGYYGSPYWRGPWGPGGGPVAPPGTYTPVSGTPMVGPLQGMGGVPAGPRIDMGGGVPPFRPGGL